MVYGSTCIDRPTGRSTDRPTDDRAINRPTDRPTDRPCPSHSRDTDTLHVPTLPSRYATLMSVQCVVEIATRLRTPTMHGKAKSRHPRNELRGWNERPANLFILALPCRCRHASLGFTYVSFSRWLLHTNPFSYFPT